MKMDLLGRCEAIEQRAEKLIDYYHAKDDKVRQSFMTSCRYVSSVRLSREELARLKGVNAEVEEIKKRLLSLEQLSETTADIEEGIGRLEKAIADLSPPG